MGERPEPQIHRGDLTIHRLIEEETTFLPVHVRQKLK
jgi:hypothetical protein